MENGLGSEEFGEDAADRPNVDGFRVVASAQKKLRGAIPSDGAVKIRSQNLSYGGVPSTTVVSVETRIMRQSNYSPESDDDGVQIGERLERSIEEAREAHVGDFHAATIGTFACARRKFIIKSAF